MADDTNPKLSRYTLSTDDQYDFNLWYKGPQYRDAITDFVNVIRTKQKYGSSNETNWEEVRELFAACLEANKVAWFEEFD